ncbi:CDP-alcohol phosphatidyltransferase family protein [Craterilacuibacter sp.]|uniref:CDP-alcohol phosphatidyltransferase family protein n=1 Tax=Craterilacuibacter sp. TaxID=2870909 RepID=UPI003F383F59
MLDSLLLPLLARPLKYLARTLKRYGVSADSVTLAAFAIGMAAATAIALHQFITGLILILLSRLLDGLDGTLARLSTPTDRGAFLDISLDFLFYSSIPFAFALAAPEANALASAALIFAFVGTGTSFLAFAVIAEKRKLGSTVYPNKGIYYLGGLTEASETLACFALMCLLPHYFALFAWGFAALCALTTLSRLAAGWHSFNGPSA